MKLFSMEPLGSDWHRNWWIIKWRFASLAVVAVAPFVLVLGVLCFKTFT